MNAGILALLALGLGTVAVVATDDAYAKSEPEPEPTFEDLTPEQQLTLRMIAHAYFSPVSSTVLEVGGIVAGMAETGALDGISAPGYPDGIDGVGLSQSLLTRGHNLANMPEAEYAEAIRQAVEVIGPQAREAGSSYIWWPIGAGPLVELLDHQGANFDSALGAGWGERQYEAGQAYATLVRPDGTYYTAMNHGPELVEVTQ